MLVTISATYRNFPKTIHSVDNVRQAITERFGSTEVIFCQRRNYWHDKKFNYCDVYVIPANQQTISAWSHK